MIPTGADVIVQGSRVHPDEMACQHEVNDLARLAADRMMSVQHPDGWWFWIIYGADGEPVAHSGRFETAAASAAALYQLRHELSVGLEYVVGAQAIARQRTRKSARSSVPRPAMRRDAMNPRDVRRSAFSHLNAG